MAEKYRVVVKNTVSTVVEVEADDEADAMDKAEEGLPGLMFLNHKYPDEGEWEAVEAWPSGSE
jgi:hypothetical protein